MAEQTMCDAASFGVSDVRTLILLLDSPEQLVCVGALDALAKYAEAASKHRIQLLSLNILNPLIDLCKSTDPLVKKSAVACLAASTELTTDFHPELRRRDVMILLISLLGPDQPPEVQDEAAFALANLARDFANKADIRSAGGIKALVALLDSPDPDVKKNVGHALSSMLEDFASRMEVRYVNGLAPLLELLASEYQDVQENALTSLIRCAEDYGNRIEIRKLNGIRRLVDFLNQNLPELHHLTLLCLANCFEDSETSSIFPELGGLASLVKMAGADDVRIKRNAALALARAAKLDRNQNYIREAGALPVLLANLAHSDPGAISHAAMALAYLGKNEINQIELSKMGAAEVFIRLLAHDDLDVCRQSVGALSSLCLNAKARPKVRQNDGVQAVLKLLSLEDIQTLLNACECLANLAEDSAIRTDIVKLYSGVHSLVMTLQKTDLKIKSTAALALARCMQDADGRMALTKEPQDRGLNHIIELIASKDINVCRNAAYALSNAAQHDGIAMAACRAGALEALIDLSKDPARHAPKFAADALEKLLNYNLSAKYWLRDHLSATNIIPDVFYDFGSAGSNLDSLHPFPSLQELKSQPVDKRREVLLIDPVQDPHLNALVQLASEGSLALRTPRQQIRQIASIVVQVLGGTVDRARLQDVAYKFKITELKVKLGTNVIPLGQVAHGTFYHRALLFKFLCDKVGLAPCTLVRGEYGRAWNVVDVMRQTLTPPKIPAPIVPSAPTTPAKPEKMAGSARVRHSVSANRGDRDGGVTGGLVGSAAGNATVATTVPVPPATLVPITLPDPADDVVPMPEEKAIVDLMFDPGRLLIVGSPEADMYQRFS
ncbi:uncharacterized protein SPPG_08599 [Spizellomyces punctatus DAOM BR117]|uniref:EDR1/CTR1/ARMC3-like peptidase-like domain-containing protein n=1 Tax=Spizellomyces punctatus (strain DAOM BR117) TaxID=645134 RepID=A0A0L0H3F8_SPIPD|nr:uncharacterized protein SPPG_08599 [Spizellomyces punctatus DAOM BR117]KNC96000.1 hypothetical protein SPPG_08599 [Spizellomyces punctatus DAOM BR117]|eukprot:XP_016604040.1 hypothetical protein SPPG_08599 [Spizellomyces punctatus DAOM BR117]